MRWENLVIQACLAAGAYSRALPFSNIGTSAARSDLRQIEAELAQGANSQSIARRHPSAFSGANDATQASNAEAKDKPKMAFGEEEAKENEASSRNENLLDKLWQKLGLKSTDKAKATNYMMQQASEGKAKGDIKSGQLSQKQKQNDQTKDHEDNQNWADHGQTRQESQNGDREQRQDHEGQNNDKSLLTMDGRHIKRVELQRGQSLQGQVAQQGEKSRSDGQSQQDQNGQDGQQITHQDHFLQGDGEELLQQGQQQAKQPASEEAEMDAQIKAEQSMGNKIQDSSWYSSKDDAERSAKVSDKTQQGGESRELPWGPQGQNLKGEEDPMRLVNEVRAWHANPESKREHQTSQN